MNHDRISFSLSLFSTRGTSPTSLLLPLEVLRALLFTEFLAWSFSQAVEQIQLVGVQPSSVQKAAFSQAVEKLQLFGV